MASKKSSETRLRRGAGKKKTQRKAKKKTQRKAKKKTQRKAKKKTQRKAAHRSKNASAGRKASPSRFKRAASSKASANAGVLVQEHARAPAFDLPNQRGERFSSASLKGRPYVLYFYPKDDTPGCTTEACDFRDALARLVRAGARVVGVSPDSPESHDRFARKYGLSFTLLSDRDKSVARAYGVWVKKNNYGREYMGIERSTFLVDANGVVRKAWRRVRVPGHVEAVLAELGTR